MGDQKTQGGWAVPEPDFDPTTAPLPDPSPAEVERPAEELVFPEREVEEKAPAKRTKTAE